MANITVAAKASFFSRMEANCPSRTRWQPDRNVAMIHSPKRIGSWILELLWILVLGSWCLNAHAAAKKDPIISIGSDGKLIYSFRFPRQPHSGFFRIAATPAVIGPSPMPQFASSFRRFKVTARRGSSARLITWAIFLSIPTVCAARCCSCAVDMKFLALFASVLRA